MSLGLQITLSGDGLAAPARLISALRPAQINPVVGRAATNTTVAHLRGLNTARPNRLGGKRTNYYAGAARGTSYAIVSDTEVVVSIAQIGIRQRFYGGTIRPRTTKYLTVPAIAEAHGKRAREFDGLTFAIIPGKGPALVRRTATVVTTKKIKRERGGTSASRLGTTVEGVSTRTTGGELQVVFWLRRKVTQRPDPSVVPDSATLGGAITTAVQSHTERALRRASNS